MVPGMQHLWWLVPGAVVLLATLFVFLRARTRDRAFREACREVIEELVVPDRNVRGPLEGAVRSFRGVTGTSSPRGTVARSRGRFEPHPSSETVFFPAGGEFVYSGGGDPGGGCDGGSSGGD